MPQRVRVKIGESEIELEGDDKFISKHLREFVDKLAPLASRKAAESRDLPASIIEASKPTSAPTPAEFLRQKKPRGGTETLLVLGKYLHDFRKVSEFSPTDVKKLSIEAKVKDIHAQYFRLAVQQGLLRTLGKRQYSLTLSGEDAVNAMPAAKKS
jgi:hypothetical protein